MAVAAPGYRFKDHPQIVARFERAFRTLEQLPCDVLVTPHPAASDLWARVDKSGGDAAFIDPDACRHYAVDARDGLQQRLASESPR